MRYILYSPEHKMTVPGFKKTTGEVIPDRTETIGPRALYRLKNLPNRRYRYDYPNIDKSMTLVKCKTLEEAKEERESLMEYCGEVFEIHEYEKGVLGPRIVEVAGR